MRGRPGGRQTGFYRRVSDSECEALYEAALSILERTGVRLLLPEAVELLHRGGALLKDDETVRISRGLVEWALRTAPSSISLYDRGGETAFTLDGGGTCYGPGSDCLHVLDHRTGERREPLMSDVLEGIAVCDSLEHIDFLMSLFLPRDVDARVADRHQMRAMLTRSSKPIVFVSYDTSGCLDAVAMAEALAGGADELSERPSIACYVNSATGLLHNREALEKLLFLSERNLPVIYVPGSQAGVTGPVTPAGAVAVAAAGVLTGLVLSQLTREGAPFLAKGWGGHGLDMRTMVYAYASPDARGTLIALFRALGIPTLGLAGASDAKLVDQQAVLEAALTLAIETVSRADLVHDLGYLESGMTGSLVQLAICDEIVDWLEHVMAGVDVGAEDLALDLVDEIGPDGQFLACEHTRRHYKAQWYPHLLERGTHEAWAAEGSTTLADRAAQRVEEILARAVEPAPSPADEELQTIVARAERSVNDQALRKRTAS